MAPGSLKREENVRYQLALNCTCSSAYYKLSHCTSDGRNSDNMVNYFDIIDSMIFTKIKNNHFSPQRMAVLCHSRSFTLRFPTLKHKMDNQNISNVSMPDFVDIHFLHNRGFPKMCRHYIHETNRLQFYYISGSVFLFLAKFLRFNHKIHSCLMDLTPSLSLRYITGHYCVNIHREYFLFALMTHNPFF